tara:strand:+ start:165 stop:356 length:192 start_codon:yes stop_codon:yes gene_type:complete
LALVAPLELSQINLGSKGQIPYSIPLHPQAVVVVEVLVRLPLVMAETVVQVVEAEEMQQTTRV